MDIEKKALELVNAVQLERRLPFLPNIRRDVCTEEALCRAIEAHETDNARHAAEMGAFRREVSEAVQEVIDRMASPLKLRRFIIPQADPLVEVLRTQVSNDHHIDDFYEQLAKRLNEASDRLGYRLELVKKEPSQ